MDDDDDDDDVPDMDDFAAQGSADAADEAALPAPGYRVATEPLESSFVKTRTYDVSITYDKYYQVGASRLPSSAQRDDPNFASLLCWIVMPARCMVVKA